MILQDEPAKGHLHFYSGLINLKAKEDYAGARRDFTKFLEGASSSAFPKETALARQYLAELDATPTAR